MKYYKLSHDLRMGKKYPQVREFGIRNCLKKLVIS